MLNAGDVFSLQAGDFLPADAVLLAAEQLEIDEFDLTGALLPVAKQAGDRIGAGTTVLFGQGTARATAVGENSEYGRIMAAKAEEWSRSVGHWRHGWSAALRRTLLVQVLLVALFVRTEAVVFRVESLALLLGLMLAVHILSWAELWRFAMLKWLRRCIRLAGYRVVNPSVVEALGEIQTCCFDKTGILTTRQMAVTDVVSPAQEGSRSKTVPADSVLFRRLVIGCTFGHQLQQGSRSGLRPIDDALYEFAGRHLSAEMIATDSADKKIEVPFVAENRYSIVSALVQGERRTWLKGAPETVLSRCRSCLLDTGEAAAISADFLLAVRQAASEYFAQGSTVIAMAERCPGAAAVQPDSYCFLALIVLANPLRPEAEAVARALAKLQVRSLIVTGDTPASAAFAATSLGIAGPDAPFLSGAMLAKMSLADISDQSGHVSLFARLTPSQKGLVVEALKRRGNHVLFAGDGANDAIALRLADVGVSLQMESSVLARNNADLLINDDLRALPQLIVCGRRFRQWRNWQRWLHWAGIAAIVGWQLVRFGPEGFATVGIVGCVEVVAAAWLARPLRVNLAKNRE